jgi:hypothetical protein
MTDAMNDYYRRFAGWLDEFETAIRAPRKAAEAIDPRDPDYSRPGIFADHNCWKCKDGKLPCAKGNPRSCENLHARND